MFHNLFNDSFVEFEQVNASWVLKKIFGIFLGKRFRRFSDNSQSNYFSEHLRKATLLQLHFYLNFFLLTQPGQNQEPHGALVIYTHA